MIVNNTNSTLLTKSFNQAINSLTEREQFVIDKRIGLS
jgi:DNA-directed RNA polymerase sigma subunit (sigma70/sigma32)